jgi:hypothetical protein
MRIIQRCSPRADAIYEIGPGEALQAVREMIAGSIISGESSSGVL